jgi:hypothetical protein
VKGIRKGENLDGGLAGGLLRRAGLQEPDGKGEREQWREERDRIGQIRRLGFAL